MKEKVLFFIQSNMGGAEKMTLYIANCLDRDKYDIIFYVIGKDWGIMKELLPSNKPRNLIKIKSFRDYLTFKIANVLRKERPSFVFSSVFPVNYRLCIASLVSPNTRVIIRSDNYLHTQSIMQKFRLFIGYRFLDYLIAQTDEMREEHIKIMRLKQSKVLTLSNPVDEKNIKNKLNNTTNPFEAQVQNIVYVGRIRPVKGIDILLKSFSIYRKENSSAKLYIIGDCTGVFEEYYKEMVNLVNSLQLSDHVNFLGFTNNPYPYMKYADCVVLPSRNEGLPNVVIEALSLGTPVAVTNSVPIIKRIVNHGKNGYVSEVDDIKEFAYAMKNAVKLGRVHSEYSSAKKEDFANLFV